MNPSHLPLAPRVDVTHTKRGGKESKARKMLWSGVEGGTARARTWGEVKYELSEVRDLLNVSESGLQVDVVHSVAEQMHLQILEGAGGGCVSPSIRSEDMPRP